jgi:hydroxymethylbilane synthase/uroporphyrinogen III methyltransferase/synthase
VIALYEAFDKTDALVSRDHIKLMDLPAGSTVGTSSPLRKKGLSELRPDLKIVGIRGCIEDRVAQVRDGKLDCAIVATCALKRLGMEDEITEILPFPTHPMQGRLAITAKRGEAAENLKKWLHLVIFLTKRSNHHRLCVSIPDSHVKIKRPFILR